MEFTANSLWLVPSCYNPKENNGLKKHEFSLPLQNGHT